MKTTHLPVCEVCEKVILLPEQGFRIIGNIFSAQVEGEGLIGKAFPTPDREGRIAVREVNEIALCNQCFFAALGFKTYKEVNGQVWMAREKIDGIKTGFNPE